ncbi:hypothetical protein CEXT_612311 [Caerostris extrusa]|uniref:Uncharacterized protein n=1 Tax=Caerostris extrusa TaxID=172846 RepID=A0AAV4PMS3_CAEEX|nr:hypothetical protein CEXT_612311 [Caerostris extrusa]
MGFLNTPETRCFRHARKQSNPSQEQCTGRMGHQFFMIMSESLWQRHISSVTIPEGRNHLTPGCIIDFLISCRGIGKGSIDLGRAMVLVGRGIIREIREPIL